MDEDLARRAKAGDPIAFEQLVRKYARLVWSEVHPFAEDPEDVVQEAFFRAWKSLRELQDPGAFRSWLLTIARRLAWRQAERAGREPPPLLPIVEPGPEDAAEQVKAALARLPERYRLVLSLHFLHGMNYGEISQVLGLGNGSLRGLIARGAVKLRAELAPWWKETKP